MVTVMSIFTQFIIWSKKPQSPGPKDLMLHFKLGVENAYILSLKLAIGAL